MAKSATRKLRSRRQSGDSKMNENRLDERRQTLVKHFYGLPEHGSPLALQHAMATEVKIAEAASQKRRSPELARHRRLIRIIGDSLAFSLLHDHTIRTLTRHPGAPASLTGQGQDFSFTMEVAKALSASGYVPIICDLTNLLVVGDIVAVAANHVLVVECKRSPLPNRLAESGCLARQRARGLKQPNTFAEAA